MNFHPKPRTKPTGLVPAPETRTEEQRYTPEETRISLAHKARHDARGNGFGFTVLRPGYPCGTLRKTLMKSTSAPRFIEADGVHWLPSRIELNRMASFPDAFQFAGNYHSHWERIGNCVPPRFMQSIAEHVYEIFLRPGKDKDEQ